MSNVDDRLSDEDFHDFWHAPHSDCMKIMSVVRPLKCKFGLSDSAIVDLVRVALAYLGSGLID